MGALRLSTGANLPTNVICCNASVSAVELGSKGPSSPVDINKGRPTTFVATKVVMPRLVGSSNVSVEF